MQKHLIFIYNADSGILNMASDWLHKILRPETYPCSLCALTYGHFGEKKEWRETLSKLNHKTEFLHQDEFNEQYPDQKFKLPCVLINKNNELSEILSAEELNAMTSLSDLQDWISNL